MWTQLFGLLIAAMGAWMIRIGRKSSAKAREAAHWPTTTATITRSQVKKRPGANAKFRFVVEYRYAIDGRDYSNDDISIGGSVSSGRIRAEKQQSAYPEGSRQTVYFNQEDPQEAYLQPVVEGGGRIELFGGIIAVLLGLLLITGMIG